MNNQDIEFCAELIRQTGTSLRAMCALVDRPPLTKEAALEKFQEANAFVESTLKEALLRRFPAIRWSSSEFDPRRQQKPEYEGAYWVCDAIDGALHFLQGFGFYSLALCLIRDGRPVLAYVYDPERDELFQAASGQGAYLNGKRIRVAAKTNLTDAYVTTSPPSFPADEPSSTELTIRSVARLMRTSFAVKMLGSVKLQLAYVACGRLDGYWEHGSNYGDFYDWLPGAFLVDEAGGSVTDMAGNSFTWGTRGIIAANETLLTSIAKELQKAASSETA